MFIILHLRNGSMVRIMVSYKKSIILKFFNYIESISDRPIWWHFLCVTIPDKITKPDIAFLLIDGGSNTDGYFF